MEATSQIDFTTSELSRHWERGISYCRREEGFGEAQSPTSVPAVQNEITASKVAAGVRCQIHDNTRDLPSFAEAAHWCESCPFYFPLRIGPFSHLSADVAWRNAVHTHAAFGPLSRQRFREHDN